MTSRSRWTNGAAAGLVLLAVGAMVVVTYVASRVDQAEKRVQSLQTYSAQLLTALPETITPLIHTATAYVKEIDRQHNLARRGVHGEPPRFRCSATFIPRFPPHAMRL